MHYSFCSDNLVVNLVVLVSIVGAINKHAAPNLISLRNRLSFCASDNYEVLMLIIRAGD